MVLRSGSRLENGKRTKVMSLSGWLQRKAASYCVTTWRCTYLCVCVRACVCTAFSNIQFFFSFFFISFLFSWWSTHSPCSRFMCTTLHYLLDVLCSRVFPFSHPHEKLKVKLLTVRRGERRNLIFLTTVDADLQQLMCERIHVGILSMPISMREKKRCSVLFPCMAACISFEFNEK